MQMTVSEFIAQCPSENWIGTSFRYVSGKKHHTFAPAVAGETMVVAKAIPNNNGDLLAVRATSFEKTGAVPNHKLITEIYFGASWHNFKRDDVIDVLTSSFFPIASGEKPTMTVTEFLRHFPDGSHVGQPFVLVKAEDESRDTLLITWKNDVLVSINPTPNREMSICASQPHTFDRIGPQGTRAQYGCTNFAILHRNDLIQPLNKR